MDWSAVWPAAAGALAQEVLHWYLLRAKLYRPEYQRLLRSPAYWTITLVMIAMSALGTALLYGALRARPDAMFVLGAAFPMILKKLVAAASDHPPVPPTAPLARPHWRAYVEAA